MARSTPVALPITKLRPPPIESYHLARPRLIERLAAVRTHRLALVVAPTGSGKTTLLAETCRLLDGLGERTAWLTLDRCERASRYFLDHLAIAIQIALPAAGREALAMLRGATTPAETVIGSLINDLTEAELPLTIFLDDFQEAETPEVANLVLYFLRYLPANVHVVVASQRDFPLSLSWARARHWSIELDWNDLRMNLEEVRSYLVDTRQLSLPDGQIVELAEQTEGWACALQMAAIALGQRVTQFPAQTGWDFADALLEELFSRLPGDTQEFLLDTAILSRLSPSLCDAVIAGNGSRQRLNELQHAHFFVQRLDDQANWLRYHHLFGSFLRKRLRHIEPERASRLHRRAGDWYATHRFINEALNHWLAADAYEPAARLLAEHGQTLLRNAEMPELENWLRRLPPAIIAASPVLSTLGAWCDLHSGRPLALHAALADAERAATSPAEHASLANEWLLLRALADITRFDWLEREAVDADLPNSFGDDRPVQRAFAHVIIGYAARHSGDLVAAWSSFRTASDLADADDLHSVTFIARYGLAVVDLLGARPESALVGLQAWFADSTRRAYWRTGGAAYLRAIQAVALMDLDRLGDAATALDEAVSLTDSCGAFGFLGIALTQRARLHAIEGRLDAAYADLARARVGAMPNHISRVLFRADLCEAWIRLRRGELLVSERLLTQAMAMLVESGQGGGENVEAWNIVHCQWLLAAHRPQEALALATAAETSARGAGRLRAVVEFLLIRAVALQHDPAGLAMGSACYRHAQQMARAGNLRLPFRLLAPYLVPLAASASAEPDDNLQAVAPNTLHQREAQILRLLEQGLRNREIAARLFLSDETVKWYLKRLYGNFEAANRVQLLAKVRRLGLLGETAS